jgi:hypothetical protein
VGKLITSRAIDERNEKGGMVMEQLVLQKVMDPKTGEVAFIEVALVGKHEECIDGIG